MTSLEQHQAEFAPWEGPDLMAEPAPEKPELPSVPPLQCPDCGKSMPLTYKPEAWGDPGETPFVYLCEARSTGCRGLMSAHPDGRPQGTPVRQDIRRARLHCHEIFDRLWQHAENMACYQSKEPPTPSEVQKFRSIARKRAYHYMAAQLQRPEPQIHIAQITDVDLLRRFYATAKMATPGLIREWWKQGSRTARPTDRPTRVGPGHVLKNQKGPHGHGRRQ